MHLILIALTCCSVPMTTLNQAEANAVVKVRQTIEVREKIVYARVGERDLLLDAILPTGSGPHPAVLVVHGGAWRSGNRMQLRGYANALAERGFACFAIDYRLAPAHKFPAQIDDCREAVKWVRKNASNYNLNPDKLGAIGYSAGGHLVCLLATTGEPPSAENGNIDTRLQAVVAGGAPTDFRNMPDGGQWAEYWMGGNLTTTPEKFYNASATAFVDKLDPPIFFFNGTSDQLVPVAWSKSCHDALKACGVRTELHTIEGAGHMFAAMNQTALTKAYQFLESELKPEPPAPAVTAPPGPAVTEPAPMGPAVAEPVATGTSSH